MLETIGHKIIYVGERKYLGHEMVIKEDGTFYGRHCYSNTDITFNEKYDSSKPWFTLGSEHSMVWQDA